MTESIEGGQRWSRPPTPISRSATPIPPIIHIPEPQNIFLEGSLPSQSQLLVSQSETQTLPPNDDDSSVILSGKVTLSLIGLDAVSCLSSDSISLYFNIILVFMIFKSIFLENCILDFLVQVYSVPLPSPHLYFCMNLSRAKSY